MPKLSLTDFVDVVLKSGTPKATKIVQVKERPDYHPALDYYKKLRDRVIETHSEGKDKAFLSNLIPEIDDQKKIQNYVDIVGAYKKWWGRKQLEWFDPPNKHFSHNGIDVMVNPELGLRINGEPHLIKLYFKPDPLRKNRTEIITHLMAKCLSDEVEVGTKMSILDIRSANLISPTVPIASLDAMLMAELAYIAALWPAI